MIMMSILFSFEVGPTAKAPYMICRQASCMVIFVCTASSMY